MARSGDSALDRIVRSEWPAVQSVLEARLAIEGERRRAARAGVTFRAHELD